MNTLNNLPELQHSPKPPVKVEARMYCQRIEPGWFTNLNQLKEYLRVLSTDDNLKETIQATIDKGYSLFDGTLYEFLYNPMIYESSSQTVSIHKTEEGARKAMEDHKAQVKAEFDDLYHNPEDPADMIVDMKWDDYQFWYIQEIEVQE